MDIQLLMQKMHSATNESDSKKIKNEIVKLFSLLSDEEKGVVRKDFYNGLHTKIDEAKRLIERIDEFLERRNGSQYVNLDKMASSIA